MTARTEDAILAALSGAAKEKGAQLEPATLAALAEAVSKVGPSRATADGTSIPDTTTLGALADAFDALSSLANLPMDGETAAKVVRLNRWANPFHIRYVKARHAIVERLGKKIDEGKWTIAPENSAEYTKALVPIRAELVAVEVGLKIATTALFKLQLTPAVVEQLGAFLEGL